jgi:predicted metal-binding membrane protein
MMLVMLAAAGGWRLLWMVVLSAVIWMEKTRWIGRRLAYPTAAGFTVLAAVLVFLSS